MEKIRWVPRDGHGTRFDGMMILAVATPLPDLIPPFMFDKANHVPDFHWASLSTDLGCTLEQAAIATSSA